MKRTFDLLFSLVGLALFFPLLLIVAVLVKLDSQGPILFRQRRVGRNGRPFWILKFRTMISASNLPRPAITVGDDPRITRAGRLLRQTKIDELPQLINVLQGDMSFVGPRPELIEYVLLYPEEFREILQMRPGITDLASLKYRDEAALLAHFPNPEEAYRKKILPDKIRLAQEYGRRSSFLFDMGVLLKTAFAVLNVRKHSSQNCVQL